MKSALVCAVFLTHASCVTGAMSRVLEIRDSRTVVVQSDGIAVAIELREVLVPKGEEPAAEAYLRRTLEGRWVYVENGDVYRSPDGLHVNGAMKRRAWLGATYLGELAFPAARQAMTHVLGNTPQAATRPRPRPRPAAKRPSKPQ